MELNHEQRELQKLAANYPKSPAEREHVKRVAADHALQSRDCPDYARTPERIDMVVQRLIANDEQVEDPTETLPPHDRAARKLTICRIRVADAYRRPRMIPDLTTGKDRFFTVEELITEMHSNVPGFRWKLGQL